MAEPLAVLQQYWGYPEFRPRQEHIIHSVLQGQDTLALLPTGGGKSICYQVPALCREGITIVVSPLIALMKDQVYNLQKRDIPAVAIYSGMPYRDIDRILDNCIHGNVKLLYLSPERLTTDLARARIQQMQVNLIAVDEAHCISQWGYDFRPPYLRIAEIRALCTGAPIMALTATATPRVVEDIQEKLQFGSHREVIQNSFERDNLAYVVRRTEGKWEKMLEILRKIPGSSVVYVRNRRKTKEAALFLQRRGISADHYHAGLDMEERSQRQDAWLQDATRVIVATNAFGMGIDKPDVRTVIHLELPDSLEAYFQEAGRAGRDGEKSYAVLLFDITDKENLQRQFDLSFPPFAVIKQVYRALGSYFQLATGGGSGETYDFDIVGFCQRYQLDAVTTYKALKILEQEGWIALTDAVFTPSSVKVLMQQEQLYDYQLKHPKLDRLLKAILRSYQGAFLHHIHIREEKLARHLKIDRAVLQRQLQHLHQDQIIDYIPQRDQPQLMFLQERVDADNLTIDHQRYKFLKNRYLERIQQAIRYAQEDHCRSQFLLAYFGEQREALCGQCDFCLSSKRQRMDNATFERYRKKLQRLLEREPLTLQQLLDSFANKHRDQVLQALKYLSEEGLIRQEKNRFTWKE